MFEISVLKNDGKRNIVYATIQVISNIFITVRFEFLCSSIAKFRKFGIVDIHLLDDYCCRVHILCMDG